MAEPETEPPEGSPREEAGQNAAVGIDPALVFGDVVERPSHPVRPQLVDPAITSAKLNAELDDWMVNAETYERRGWLLLESSEQHVDVAFVASVPLAGILAIPVITACVRIDYRNYDLWPPSVTFIDPRTRRPSPPIVRAPAPSEVGVRDAIVDGHPHTGLPFLCLPGIREYHSHPQHSGDDWLLHRRGGAGRLAVICERIWQRMVLNIVGLRVTVQAFPPAFGTQLDVALAQGDTAMLAAGQLNGAPPGMPPPAEMPGTEVSAAAPDSMGGVE